MSNLDRAINNDFLTISKSLLPYLNSDRQKPMAIFIKVIELMYTIDLFSKEDAVKSMTRGQAPGWEKDFLRDVKGQLSSDKAYFIDAILKITEARDLLSHDNTRSEQPDYHLAQGDSGIPEDMPFPPDPSPLSSLSAAPGANPHTKTPNTQGPQPTANKMPPPEQVISQLSPLLDPNQLQLLKVLSSFIKPPS